MDLAWGDGLGEDTQGLDIVGVRGLDQRLEAALVNGITTVSLRGRYFCLLPWALGEFFSTEVAAEATEFDEARFKSFLARVEFLALACTSLDEGKGDPSGALGRVIFQSEIAALSNGQAVAFPAGRNGSMLGTYFGPCRALGLLRTADGLRAAPFLLTPRGQAVWEARKTALGEGPWRALLWEAETLSPADVQALTPHFSLKRLAQAAAEAEAIRNALLTPWVPEGPAALSVSNSYERFGQTIAWLRATGKGMPLRADALLAEAWKRTAVGTKGEFAVEQTWAEYEWRRRLHFALELILSAVSDTVRDRGQATLDEIVEEWREEPELPVRLTTAWSQAIQAWGRTGAEAVHTVPADLYLAEAPPDDLAKLKPHARALAAFALVAALTQQSISLRTNRLFRDYQAPGESALDCVETAGDEPFVKTLRALIEVVVQAHLATTFRKMGGGQKCSLRFFPEGSRLLTTDLDTGAGRSGSQLWNVIRVLEDAAVPGIGANE